MTKVARRKAKAPKLPDKPSELIALALADLAKAERSKRYIVNMGFFHEPTNMNTCIVCFAGSVMAGTLKSNPDELFGPYDFDVDTKDKLLWLDSLRSGCDSRNNWLGKSINKKLGGCVFISFYHNPPAYASDPAAFKRSMRSLATKLRWCIVMMWACDFLVSSYTHNAIAGFAVYCGLSVICLAIFLARTP
jgi:hypothetical protein